MTALTARDEKLLRCLHRLEPYSAALSICLILLGGSYTIWGAQRLKVGDQIALQRAFDGPIAQVEALFYDQSTRPAPAQLQTVRERELWEQLNHEHRVVGSWVAFTLRLFLGQFMLGIGSMLLNGWLIQWPLVRIIEKLRR